MACGQYASHVRVNVVPRRGGRQITLPEDRMDAATDDESRFSIDVTVAIVPGPLRYALTKAESFFVPLSG